MSDANTLHTMLKRYTKKCPIGVKIIRTRLPKDFLREQKSVPIKYLVSKVIETYNLPSREDVSDRAAIAYSYQNLELGNSCWKLYLTLGEDLAKIELEERPKELLELLVEFDADHTDFVGAQQEIFKFAKDKVEKRPAYIR